MAFPLKFLRRLVSRRGERKHDADKVDGAKRDVLAIADPTVRVAEEGSEHAARLAASEPLHGDPSDAVAAETAPVDEVETETPVTADGARANIPAVGGSASANETNIAVTAAHDATELPPAVAGVTPKQRGHSKNIGLDIVPAAVSQGSRTPSNETMILDEEIKLLREQLASKLKIQNAQLKRMLERFER